jgi:hypothetical protein
MTTPDVTTAEGRAELRRMVREGEHIRTVLAHLCLALDEIKRLTRKLDDAQKRARLLNWERNEAYAELDGS